MNERSNIIDLPIEPVLWARYQRAFSRWEESGFRREFEPDIERAVREWKRVFLGMQGAA